MIINIVLLADVLLNTMFLALNLFVPFASTMYLPTISYRVY